MHYCFFFFSSFTILFHSSVHSFTSWVKRSFYQNISKIRKIKKHQCVWLCMFLIRNNIFIYIVKSYLIWLNIVNSASDFCAVDDINKKKKMYSTKFYCFALWKSFSNFIDFKWLFSFLPFEMKILNFEFQFEMLRSSFDDTKICGIFYFISFKFAVAILFLYLINVPWMRRIHFSIHTHRVNTHYDCNK